MEFILNVSLIDIAAFVFIIGGSIIIIRMSARTGKSIFRIIIGFENKKPFILLTTTKERIVLAVLIIFSFVMFYLWTHGVGTVGDLFAKL